MASHSADPYQTLGVSPGISEAELRAAYRRLIQLHHPDHNGGSTDSARRFEEIQDAYARIRALRSGAPPRTGAASAAGARSSTSAPPRGTGQPPPPPPADPEVESRMADLERQLREAHMARERARQAAREAAARGAEREATGRSADRPTDEELGYVTTDDSFSKILADARSEVSDWLAGAREKPVPKRVADVIDELDRLTSKLTGQRPPRSRDDGPA
jgi:curved DNA-binding protein CbpA